MTGNDMEFRRPWHRECCEAVLTKSQHEPMRLPSFIEFMARAGSLYGKFDLCPPFHLKEFAEAWLLQSISLDHCLSEISQYLVKHSGRHRCGSGDDSLPYVDRAIRRSWDEKHRLPRAKPERTDRYFQRVRDTHTSDRVPSPNFAVPVRPAPPAPRQKRIEGAKALLRRELADGEVATVAIEQTSKDVGIALRTLDRARRELGVISRRTGFGKTGRSWLSLPNTKKFPSCSDELVGKNAMINDPDTAAERFE
jgi:hypothetical protein